MSVRTVDPPSRLTPAGVPNALNSATGGAAPAGNKALVMLREAAQGEEGVWRPPRGGVRREVVAEVVRLVVERGGCWGGGFGGVEGGGEVRWALRWELKGRFGCVVCYHEAHHSLGTAYGSATA